ncbi:MAG: S1 family peptidase [Bdellovibrionales bacterium]|nr:S1 family peptidase [Bdellovibrionales bacterium]
MTVRTLITFLVLQLALVACTSKKWDQPDAQLQHEDAIVGGYEVTPENPEAAYVVMIYGEKANGQSYVCTGTFISDSVILTAAHCLSDRLELMSVFFGVKPFEVDATTLTLTDMKAYGADLEDYKPDEREDMALIAFSGGLPKGAKIAELPEAVDGLEKAGNLLALGYGRTDGLGDSETMGQDIGILREVLLRQKNVLIKENDFTVSQTDKRGVCYGDSGGPAFAVSNHGKSVRVVGVASGVFGSNGSGVKTDECQGSSIYMRTNHYLEWITGYVAKQGTK